MPLQLYKIASSELTTTASSVTFSNIPQGYTDLKVVMSIRNGTNAETTGAVYFNGDTTDSNYLYKRLLGDGSFASSAGTAHSYIFYMSINSDTANVFANCELYIPSYTSSTQKPISAETATENNATGALLAMAGARWSGTAAITSVQVRPYAAGGGSFAANSTFTLYGIL